MRLFVPTLATLAADCLQRSAALLIHPASALSEAPCANYLAPIFTLARSVPTTVVPSKPLPCTDLR